MQRVDSGGHARRSVEPARRTTRSGHARARLQRRDDSSMAGGEADGEIRALQPAPRRRGQGGDAGSGAQRTRRAGAAQCRPLAARRGTSSATKERLAALVAAGGAAGARDRHAARQRCRAILQLAISARDLPVQGLERAPAGRPTREGSSASRRSCATTSDSTRTVKPERVRWCDVRATRRRIAGHRASGERHGARAHRRHVKSAMLVTTHAELFADRASAAADPRQPHHQRRRRRRRRTAAAHNLGPDHAARQSGRHARACVAICRALTTASASAPRMRRASSSRSTRPRGAARAPGSGWRSAASWRRRSADASPSSRARGTDPDVHAGRSPIVNRCHRSPRSGARRASWFKAEIRQGRARMEHAAWR